MGKHIVAMMIGLLDWSWRVLGVYIINIKYYIIIIVLVYLPVYLPV